MPENHENRSSDYRRWGSVKITPYLLEYCWFELELFEASNVNGEIKRGFGYRLIEHKYRRIQQDHHVIFDTKRKLQKCLKQVFSASDCDDLGSFEEVVIWNGRESLMCTIASVCDDLGDFQDTVIWLIKWLISDFDGANWQQREFIEEHGKELEKYFERGEFERFQKLD